MKDAQRHTTHTKHNAHALKFSRNYDIVIERLRAYDDDEYAPLNIYTEEIAWANESVVYNST